MRSTIWPITRIVLGVGLMGAASLAFLDQGSILIRQSSLADANGGASIVLAGPLAGNGNGNDNASTPPRSRTTERTPTPTTTPTRTTAGVSGAGQQGQQPLPPPAPVAQGECQFVRGFADLHRILNGRDGTC